MLAELVARMAQHGIFNMLLSDGRALFAHASTKLVWLHRQNPFPRVRPVDRDLEVDLAAAHAPGDHMAVVATAPLTSGEPWTPFDPGELRVFMDGRSVWHRRSPVPGVRRSEPVAA